MALAQAAARRDRRCVDRLRRDGGLLLSATAHGIFRAVRAVRRLVGRPGPPHRPRAAGREQHERRPRAKRARRSGLGTRVLCDLGHLDAVPPARLGLRAAFRLLDDRVPAWLRLTPRSTAIATKDTKTTKDTKNASVKRRTRRATVSQNHLFRLR